MTARHQVRFGNRRLARDRSAIDATPAPRLGEMLQLARENKGVDLYRAERDTKIRLRYLAALEDSDFDELPAPVYTKGFLRNYAIYLGLDPEDVLLRWREEMQVVRNAEKVPVAPPPRPIAAPRRGPAITPGLLMGALLTLTVVAFVGFIALQLVRFVEIPAVDVTNPRTHVSEVNSENIVISGTSGPGSVITIHAPGGQLYSATADETGAWSREVPLARGRNDFTISANDPVTRRDSEPVSLIVNVPLPAASAGASATPQPPMAIDLSLSSPVHGSVVGGGPVVVSGSTTATRVTIAVQPAFPAASPPAGSPPAGSPPAAPTATAEPAPATPAAPAGSPAPGASVGASPGPAAGDLPLDVTVPPTGQFSEELNLLPGAWTITVTASSAGLEPVSETRSVTVPQPSSLVLVIDVTRRDSWVRVVADGQVVQGYGGRTLERGETHTFTAISEIWLRAGNAGALDITLNGQDLGLLGEGGEVGNWLFRVGQEPERTTERR